MKKIILLAIGICMFIMLQAQVSKTVNVTAGTLSTLLTANEKTTITDLTITGTIDARDFKTMRDSMQLLTEVDLSAVMIVAYTGTGGTSYSDFYPANSVPERAFQGKTNLKSVILPSSVTSTSSYAFAFCSGLTLVTLPEGLTSIASGSFHECSSITSFNIPSSVNSIGNSAFYNSSGIFNVDAGNQTYSSVDGVLFNKKKTTLIQCPVSKTGSYIIPSSVITIGSGSFTNVIGITGTLTIPSSVNIIEASAFNGCVGLTSVIIPSSVASIGNGAFSNCTNLISITANSGIPINLSSSWDVFYNVNKTSCTLYVPFGTTNAYKAADKWKDFTTIVEMTGVFPSANSFVFGANASTKNLFIASSIAWTAISNEGWLTIDPTSGAGSASVALTVTDNTAETIRTATVTVSAQGIDDQIIKVTQYGKIVVTAGGLNNTLGDQLSAIASLTLTGTIDARDFKTMRDNMPMLSNLDLSGATVVAYNGTEGTSQYGNNDYPANTIPETAFMGVHMFGKESLISVVLPTSVTSIGKQAFGHCMNLTSVVLPDGLTIIGEHAFEMNFGLKSFTIPASVTTIQSAAFFYCNNLSSITANPFTPVDLSSSSDVFFGINTATCILHVPIGTIAAYQSADQWKAFINMVEIPEFKLSATTANIAATSGSTVMVDLTTGLSWTASSDKTWLTVNPTSGTGNQSLTFTAETNPQGSERTAIVTVSATGVEPHKITVTQAAGTLQQTLSLNTGWNIISANVVPVNLNLKDIFQALIDAGTLKKVMDETGKTIENFGAFGGWKNNIGNLNTTKGYKVNVNATSTLSLEGTPVPLPLDIALNTGWNIIAYPCLTTQDAKALVQSLIDSGKLKKVMDESGKTIENFGAFGGWKNNIGNFVPGKGYKVNVNVNCTLTIPATTAKAATIVPEVIASTHFAKVFKGNGTDHMSINLVNLQASGLVAGDEIGIFDGKQCVGSATVGTEQLIAGTISIPASANDEMSETANGFTSGHPVELQLYRANQTYQLNSTKLDGNESFEKNGSLFVQANANDLTTVQIIDNSALFKCYPNPFTSEITIEVQNLSQAEVTVEIYNMTGQRIKNLFKGTNNGNLVLKWNGSNDSGQQVAPGVYLCKVNGQSKQVIFEGGKRNK